MAFTGEEAGEFPLAEAAVWTSNYRKANPGKIKAHYFGNRIIRQVLDQPGCVGLRTYYALDTVGVQQMIIVGVDANGNDMCTGTIAERSIPCPNMCSINNALNS